MCKGVFTELVRGEETGASGYAEEVCPGLWLVRSTMKFRHGGFHMLSFAFWMRFAEVKLATVKTSPHALRRDE